MRLQVSESLQFDDQVSEFLSKDAEKCFQKRKTARNNYRSELKKMFDDEENMPTYFWELLKYGLIPSQSKWSDTPEIEKQQSKDNSLSSQNAEQISRIKTTAPKERVNSLQVEGIVCWLVSTSRKYHQSKLTFLEENFNSDVHSFQIGDR